MKLFQTLKKLFLCFSDKGEKNLNELDELSIHREVLQENLDLLIKDIDLEHADLIDDLLTGE